MPNPFFIFGIVIDIGPKLYQDGPSATCDVEIKIRLRIFVLKFYLNVFKGLP